jgi:NADPH:quinone reductase
MKAVYIKEFGGPENLEVCEVPDPPKPTGTSVLISVNAAGLNRADLLQRKGLYPPPAGYSPNIPGMEFAGEVAENGEKATRFKTGDRVFGITAGEAQAEYVVIDESVLAKIPDNLNFAEAAAVPEVFITAHDALFTQCKLKSGETLLIHAIGSGVGLAALQLAKANGVRVFGTSRTAEKLERCREFGLDEGIVVSGDAGFSEELKTRTEGKGVNVILDLVGASYFNANLANLAAKGRLILVGLTGGAMTEFDLRIALHKRLKIIGTVLRARSTEEKAEATRLFVEQTLVNFENGTIRPNLDRVFAADSVAAAHAYLESNESFGKVVLGF